MQGRSKRSTSTSPSPSPSPERPPSPASKPDAEDDINTDNAAQNSRPPPALTAGHKENRLSNRTLRIRCRQAAKPADGSPFHHAGSVASPDQDLDVPIRELIALVSGQGGGSPAKDVDESSVKAGPSNKIKLHLKRKPAEDFTIPRSPICLFCLRRFSTRTDLLDHLQMEHSSTEEQVHDQTPDHEQGEDNGGGDSGGEKKSEEEEGSSAATDQARNEGLDLNHQPIEEVLVSAEKKEEKGTSGDETIDDGPRKKIRFDLNELPPDQGEHEN